ncbi:hypothetical protein COJ46_01690 [Bacillus sp. AFS077874]|uniref:hypothetical protein n=1 Tax=unclassified Bacillus (in: firmicutes) TaxID=185979 RepID=UPI000BEE29E0|nr:MULTISPECIES: hypothetical protein [unclassified Bacillus (in: firmicutes)]PEC50949.1 hypothetical protein CON00_04350 [Bacillus sp. AFS096315]PFM83259.1 hypothetical protein COJ46_01690 [Bacillus sp. AFS077874]
MNGEKKLTIFFVDDFLRENYSCKVTCASKPLPIKEINKNLTIDIPELPESNRIEILFTSTILSDKKFWWFILPIWIMGAIGSITNSDIRNIGFPYNFLLVLELDESFDVEVVAHLNFISPFSVKGSGYKEIQNGILQVKGYKSKWFIGGHLPILILSFFIAFILYFSLVAKASIVAQLIFIIVGVSLLFYYGTYLYKILTQKVLNS